MLRCAQPVWLALAIGVVLVSGQPSSAQPGIDAGAANNPTGAPVAAPPLGATPDQCTKIVAIIRDAYKQAFAVLTPDQQAQLITLIAKATGDRRTQIAHVQDALKVLDLPKDQQAKINAIKDNRKAKAQAIKADAKLTNADKRTQMQTLVKDTLQQYMQALTEEQRQELWKIIQRQNRQPNLTEHLTTLAKLLNMTDDQQAKVKGILNVLKTKTDAITADATLAGPDRMKKLSATQQEAMQHFHDLLTPQLIQQVQALYGGMGAFNDYVLKQLDVTADQQAKIKAIREKAFVDIRLALNDDQQKVYDQLDAQQKTMLQLQFDMQAVAEDDDEE